MLSYVNYVHLFEIQLKLLSLNDVFWKLGNLIILIF